MPEIKNTFLKGRMNKDLDERLVPKGEYRDALNIEIATSENSDIGAVKNILGNKRIETAVPEGYTCVASIANEKTNKLYWFISKYNVDAIIEYDHTNDITNYVLVDTKAGTEDAVLKFFGNAITGINIIDNLLFWTDNRGEPKKINIDTCKAGTAVANSSNFPTHTQLLFDNGSFHGITVELTAVNSDTPLYTNEGRYVWYDESQIRKLIVGSQGQELLWDSSKFDNPYEIYQIRHYRDNNFLGTKRIKIWNGSLSTNGCHFRTEYYNDGNSKEFKVGDVIFGNNVGVDIEESHVTVIKTKPLNAFSVKVNHLEQSLNTNKIPNLFETTFPRFSYRYKFRDGEYSAFAPFTQPVFNAKYPKDTSKSTDGSISYTKDNVYDIKEPYNKAMTNSIHSIDLGDFITTHTPEDVVEIEILYKKEDSSVIYSIATIKAYDKEWHSSSDYEGLGNSIGIGKATTNTGDGQYQAIGSQTKGRYKVTTENIYAALPANQLLRPWDNVPRKALAQEVTGNRVVYGNYLQNYEIPLNPKVYLGYEDRKNPLSSFEFKGLPSIKSQRNYQLGVVLTDKYGRETPVFTSQEGAANVSWQDSSGNANASKSNQLIASIDNNFPEWVDSLKFFVKQTSNEYYNLTMQRAWVTKSTYELDNSEGHLWISFPSSDRNKISEEDYIILKKKIEPNASQVDFENKFKVIDIANEAPDSIKYRLVNYGTISNNGLQADDATTGVFANVTNLFTNPSQSIQFYDNNTLKGTDTLILNLTEWEEQLSAGFEQFRAGVQGDDSLNVKDFYVSWSRVGTDNAASKKYKVVAGSLQSAGAGSYLLKLSTHISKADADIAHCFGESSQTTTGTSTNQLNPADGLHPDLVFQLQKKELIDSEDFSGSFFVKISKNQVSSIIETGNEVSNLEKYQVTAKNSVYYLLDKLGTTATVNLSGGSYGLTNYNGDLGTQSGDNSHLESGADYNDSNQNPANLSGGTSGISKLSDHSSVWSGVLNAMSDHNISGLNRFFVDATHMASGQSDASDYAKYGCVTWSGATAGASTSPENSCWSYPPLKTWITDFKEKQDNIALSSDSIFYQNELISQNIIGATADPDYNNLKVDGWVGPLQNVSREKPAGGFITINHVNGLEGIITTEQDHTIGPRRWFSGMNGTDNGVGQDTKTYANSTEEERHFMHLSFLAPGKDLHDNDWTGLSEDDTDVVYGPGSFAAKLQGIWGGGVFTGKNKGERFGSETIKWKHFPMEGNHDANQGYLPETPGPGIGQGYNLKYKEAHNRQWDPTFLHDKDDAFVGDPENRTRDFIRNLYPGSKFRFNRTETPESSQTPAIDTEVYTIKKVVVKKLYNHTSWRRAYNRYFGSPEFYNQDNSVSVAYKSVEQTALEYLGSLDDDGIGGDAAQIKNKIVQFGRKHNRRLCYIIELDKNPTDSSSAFGNPLTRSSHNSMSGDITQDNYTDIEFLDPVQDLLLSDLSKFPAIWELSPKKQQTDLDIYYEASNSIPVNINEQTNELFAPVGCKVEVLNASSQENLNEVYLESWDGNTAIFNPGFQAYDGSNEIDYTNASFKFIRQDGSYTIAEAGGQQLIGVDASSVSGYLKKDFIFKKQIGSKIKAGLSWYNCFSFGNGLESNRINDDFNEVFISNGVKASTTTQQPYKEERRKSGLIYSGIYNSNSGVNDLNQFIMAEKITKDLNPTYGSIQKLFQRRISLVAFCEDRVIQITSNKDALFNADGDSQLISTNAVLGDATPFVGEYGISNNPESFASESYRAYFTDKQRGAVLRLSKDGITPVSSSGMHDWFRDNLKKHPALIGTYDAYKNNYNVTLTGAYAENLIFNSEFNEGAVATPQTNLNLNLIENGKVYNHTNAGQYDISLNNYTFPTQGTFTLGSNVERFIRSITVTNHPEIPEGMFQEEYNSTAPTADIAVATTTGAGIQYVQPQYDVAANLQDDGWWYDPRFTDSSNQSKNMFGVFLASVSQMTHDDQVSSNIKRTTSGVLNDEYSTPPTSSPIDNPNSINGHAVTSNNAWYSGHDPLESKPLVYPNPDSYTYQHKISRCVTRNSGNGAILFDRANPSDSYVEFDNIGGGIFNSNPLYGVNNDYAASTNSGTPITSDLKHSTFFNGDELHIQVEMICYPTVHVATDTSSQEGAGHYGYNYIKPKIQLFCEDPNDPTNRIPVPNDRLIDSTNGVAYDPNSSDPFAKRHSKPDDLGGDFVDENTSSGGLGAYQNYTGDKYKLISTETSPGSSRSAAIFPLTAGIAPLKSMAPGPHPGTSPTEVTVGCSFKFKDPTQQYDDGTPMDPNSIQEAIVVKNLSIRISNAEPAYGPTATYYNATNSFLAATNRANWNGVYRGINQLWEIKKIFTKKGYGITDPYEPEVPEVTLYDDPTGAMGQNGVSFNQLYDFYGNDLQQVDDGTGNMVWAVNGAVVNSYVQVNNIAIPSSTIPAWVEVRHDSPTDWNFGVNNGWAGWGASNASTWSTVKTFNWFGNEAPALDETYTLGDGTPGSYKIKNLNYPPYNGYQVYPFIKSGNSDFNSLYADYVGDPTLEPNNFTPPSTFTNPGVNVVGNAVVSPPSYEYTDVVSHYWRIKHNSSGGNYSLSANLGSNNEYKADGSWYLIDIEYLNSGSADVFDSTTMPSVGGFVNASTNNTSLSIAGDGNIHVPGVCDHNTITNPNLVVNKYGLGLSKGGSTNMGIKLLPVFRTEYDHDRWVLRAIFQVDTASYINTGTTYLDYLNLSFNSFKNDQILVAKIISKDISVFTSTGGAQDWTKPSVYDKKHTFTDGYYVTNNLNKYSDPTSKANMYYHANTLSWDNVPKFDIDGSTEISRYKQNFSLAPTGTQEFTFNFSVGENTFAIPSVFSGELSVMITADDIDGSGTQATLNVTGIDTVGDYEIVFKLGEAGPVLTLDPSGGNATVAVGSSITSGEENTIYFYNDDASNNVSASVSGIELSDSTEIFVGASVGSWNFDGFEPTIDEHIVWDSSGRIQFSNAPLFDDTFVGVNPVMISQSIETPINRHEKYKVEFTYKIVASNDAGGDGELHMYYFNSQGYGFRIKNIGSGTGYNVAETITVNSVGGISKVEEIVTIEELASTEVTETYGSGVEALRNTIVVRKENENDSSSKVTAWIDGISITQMFNYPPEADYEKTTITFSEKTNGWTSFKSFIPENGVSLSNQYFTFNNAKLYKHYVPMLDGATGVTTEEANNYNVFYGENNSKSFIKTVLNAEPSVVKTFNTLNYEGSQAHVTKPSSAVDQFGNNAITINNQKAWSLGADIKGWNVTEIKTDLDSGNLKNFIKKEGKWFGYIKGQTGNVLDTSMFSVLGIGAIKSVQDVNGTPPPSNTPPLSGSSVGDNIFTINTTVDNTNNNSTNNNIFTTPPPSNNNTSGNGTGGY